MSVVVPRPPRFIILSRTSRITVYVLIHLFEGLVNDVWVFASRIARDEKLNAILKERGFKSLQELRDRTEDEDFASVETELRGV